MFVILGLVSLASLVHGMSMIMSAGLTWKTLFKILKVSQVFWGVQENIQRYSPIFQSRLHHNRL